MAGAMDHGCGASPLMFLTPLPQNTDGNLLHAGLKICAVSCLKEDLSEADRHKLNNPDSTC